VGILRTIYEISKSFIGVREIAGVLQNPFIVKIILTFMPWLKGDRIEETPWCAMYQSWLLKEQGLGHLIPKNPMRARSFLNVGDPVKMEDLQVGDYVIFWRGHPSSTAGHVAQFDGWNKLYPDHIPVLGANQSNQVNVSNYPKKRFLEGRRINSTITTKSLINHSFVSRFLINNLKLDVGTWAKEK
jgi:uncharacterized protein (TIGR02594 family)